MGVLIISFGLGAFNVLYGTLWFPYKIVMIPILIYTIFNLNFSSVKIINSYFVILIISVIVALTTVPDIPGVTFLQGPIMRPFVQLYTYAGMGLLIPFFIFVINSRERLHFILKLYFRLSEIVIVLGFIHLIFIILGLEFIPIIRSGGSASQFAAFGMEGVSINRIYGFSGEPKTLATFTLPYLFISIYNYIEKHINISKTYHITFIITSIIVIIYTFSSALLISAALCIVLIPYIFRNRIKNNIVRIFSVLVLGALIISEINDLYVKPDEEKDKTQFGWLDIVYERTFGRLDKDIETRYESVAIDYIFNEKPVFLITGFGLGMYNYHLPMPMHRRGVEPIDSGWVTILMDLGFLGILFFIALFRFILKLKKHNSLYYRNNVILNSFLIGAITGFVAHIGNNALYQIFLFSGLAIAAINVLSEEENGEISE